MKKIFLKSFYLFLAMSAALAAIALEEDYFQKEYYSAAKRDVSVIASPEGYYPKNIVVFAGEQVQFYVTGSKQFPSCFILENTELFLPANPGQISEGRHKFERPGKFKFYCPQGKIKGFVTVLEHPEMARERRMKRKIASEKEGGVKIWRPRDE